MKKVSEKLFMNDAIAKSNKALITTALLLLGIGVIAVFSADISRISLSSKGVKQVIWASGGVFVALIFTLINYRKLNLEKPLRICLLIFTAMLVFLAGCSFLHSLGIDVRIGNSSFGVRRINGAYRWFSLGYFNFQPSVFVKVFLILFIAAKLSKISAVKSKFNTKVKAKKIEKNKDDDSNFSSLIQEKIEKHKEILEVLLFSMIITTLVLFQPSTSVAASILVVAFAMLAMKNAKFFMGKNFIVVALVLAAIGFVAWNGFPHIRNRIMKGGDNFQSEQAVLAISSGGLTGLGIGHGEHKYPGRLPEVENDFIFSLIAQETGFIGSFIFLAIYIVFIFAGFYTALRTQDDFGKFAAFGITANYAFSFLAHLFVNLGFINTGASLPFVSYGGTAIFADATMLGILLNISAEKCERSKQ